MNCYAKRTSFDVGVTFVSLCFACPAICGWNGFCCFVWRAH